MIKKTDKSSFLRFFLVMVAAFAFTVFLSLLVQHLEHGKLNVTQQGEKTFEKQQLLSNVPALFDLGVTDIDDDTHLDIFTSNHSSQQFILMGSDDHRYADNFFSQLGLSQDPEFPGLEPSSTVEKVTEPGFYIYWNGRKLVLEVHQVNEADAFSGTIGLSSSIGVFRNSGFNVDIKEKKLSNEAIVSTLNFSPESNNATLILQPYNQSLPIAFALTGSIPLAQIYVGREKVNPDSRNFTLYVRDRHGMAWNDYNNEGLLDLFVVRGGLRARMDSLPETYRDELLLNDGNSGYVDASETVGLTKNACPALQTAWVDFDNDGLLDIYTTCFSPPITDRSFPNQLHQQLSDGTFQNVASDVGLDFDTGGSFVWLDVDRDADQDLLWADDSSFWLYKNSGGRFIPQEIGRNPGGVLKSFGENTKFTVSDFDNDGDLDAFFSSFDGNVLLENDQGEYSVISPDDIGLPKKSAAANWVDFDNDGLIDLHAIPQGIYSQGTDHSFYQLNLLNNLNPKSLDQIIATWFDADNDGKRDLLLSESFEESLIVEKFRFAYQKLFKKALPSEGATVSLYMNRNLGNHWLELNLVGLQGNRPSIGTLVELTTVDGVQLQSVGQAEGSYYSQGHYRLYFGLGTNDRVDSIKVYWPDGSQTRLNNLEVDELVTIKR